MILQETEHFVLEVAERFDQANNYRPRYVIRNKVTNVDEVTLDLLHLCTNGIKELEAITYPTEGVQAALDLMDVERPAH